MKRPEMGFRSTEAAEQGKGSAEGPVSAEFSPGEIRQQLGTLLRSRETKRYTSASKKEGNSSSTSANPPRFGLQNTHLGLEREAL